MHLMQLHILIIYRQLHCLLILTLTVPLIQPLDNRKDSLLEYSESTELIYLTHSINADIFFVVRAGSAIFNFAGHSKEEVIVFCNAVQLADVFICTEERKRGIIKNDGITCKMHKLFFKFYCLVSLQLQRLLTLQVCTKTETQKTATTNAPRGIHMGLQVYFVVQISYHRQVSTAVFD